MRILLALALVMAASPALAGPVSLRPNPVDEDGRVTLGDVFDNAGSASGTLIGYRNGPSLVFEAGQLQAIALRAGLQWSNPQGYSRVVVRQGAAQNTTVPGGATTSGPASGPIAAQPGATVDVLSYVRNLATGDIVQPEDVQWTTMQAHMAPAGGPRDAEQVIGLAAKRPLRAGAAVASRDLSSPRVIARNDMVEVAFISGGVKLTVTGRATRDAAVGEPVPVLNLTSNRTIDAVATGPGEAVTGPGAQMARANPQQFAAR
ncbi:flagellar basal body P-ring formation chaperone FlgA [soil metagenome]